MDGRSQRKVYGLFFEDTQGILPVCACEKHKERFEAHIANFDSSHEKIFERFRANAQSRKRIRDDTDLTKHTKNQMYTIYRKLNKSKATMTLKKARGN